MSDMTDNANELDNYGVWVKNSPQDINGESQAEDDLSINEMDLPDFGDFEAAISSSSDDQPIVEEDSGNSQEDDIFNDLNFTSTPEESDADISLDNGDTTLSPDELANISVSETPEETAFDEGDTSLNPDELANITMGQDTEAIQEESAADDADFSEPDFSVSDSEIEDDAESAALSNAFFSDESEDDPFKEPATDSLDSDSDIDIDISDSDPDFSLDEPSIEEPAIEETAVEESAVDEPALSEDTTVSADDFGDGDVDLGSFMSDSGDGGEFSFEDGDIDLGDFMGEGFGGGSKEPAEIQDEQTLDISVDFDEDAKNIAMEDTPENEAIMNPKPVVEQTAAPALDPNGATDEMFSSFDAAVAAVGIPEPSAEGGQDSGVSSGEDGEIDLSEFGFSDDDSNIGMTNGPDGANPVKKEVVNYDMKVTVDGDSKTPPVLDVVNGKISSTDTDYDSEEDESTSIMGMSSNTASPEISEKGKEILEQIMGELASLKDEIKSIKNEFAEMQTRPMPAGQDATAEQDAAAQEDSGFFGADDGDDTIALSGSEMSNILNSAEFSEEQPAEETQDSESMEEPQIEENAEPEMDETAISEDELNIEDPTIASVTGDIIQTQGMAENGLPDEISVPTPEGFNNEAMDDFMAEDSSIEESLTEDKLNYLGESPAMEEPAMDEPTIKEPAGDSPDVSEIMKENISMQDDEAGGIGIGSDIDAAFNEADADESDIMDSSLAEKDNYENSVSDIVNENISMQDDEATGIGIGSDIDAAFDEADAAESDIMDSSLAEKDAYEKEINKSVDVNEADNAVDPMGDSLSMDEPVIEEPAIEDSIEETSVEEPVVGDSEIEETVVEAPLVEEPMSADFEESAVEEHTPEANPSSMPKDLKREIVSVLSYMDQLLENLPEDKITEFAKSEHFVTYKKLFDELGLA